MSYNSFQKETDREKMNRCNNVVIFDQWSYLAIAQGVFGVGLEQLRVTLQTADRLGGKFLMPEQPAFL